MWSTFTGLFKPKTTKHGKKLSDSNISLSNSSNSPSEKVEVPLFWYKYGQHDSKEDELANINSIWRQYCKQNLTEMKLGESRETKAFHLADSKEEKLTTSEEKPPLFIGLVVLNRNLQLNNNCSPFDLAVTEHFSDQLNQPAFVVKHEDDIINNLKKKLSLCNSNDTTAQVHLFYVRDKLNKPVIKDLIDDIDNIDKVVVFANTARRYYNEKGRIHEKEWGLYSMEKREVIVFQDENQPSISNRLTSGWG